MNSYKFLRLTEYAVVAATVVGAIATISTQQVAYTAVPLAFSVSLNLVSRHQQEKLLEQRLSQTKTDVGQQLQQVQRVLKKLDLSIADAASSAQANSQSLSERATQQIQSFSSDIGLLQERLEQQNTTSRTSIDQVAEELRQLQVSVTEAVSLAQDSQSLSAQAIQQIQSLSNEIGSVQERLEQQSTTSQIGIDQVTERLHQLETLVADLAAESESVLSQVVDLSATREQQTNFELTTQRLNSNITQLQDGLNGLKLEVDEFRTQLEASFSTPQPDFPHNIIPTLPTTDECDREIVLGIDFGTGFTKVCFWDVGSDQAEIVTFAASTVANPTLEQALIPTKLAILSDDTLLTGLTMAEWENSTHAIKQSVDFIKMRLADLDTPADDSWRLEQLPELDDPIAVESICAYYLSQIITQSQTWIQKNRSDLFKNQTVHWNINVGVPAAYCDPDDSPTSKRFRRVLCLAWVLSHSPLDSINLTLPKLQQLTVHLQNWMRTTNVNLASLPCITTPEITAAAWSFLSSQAAQDGFYTLFDIGDGTLDGSAFRFWRDGGTRRLDIYETEVKPLGVTALTKQAAAELNQSFESIRQSLSGSNDIEFQQQIQNSQSRNKVQRLVAGVVFDGNKKHHISRCALAKDEIGTKLRVLVGGGGSNIPFFQNTIESTYSDFNHKNIGIPSYQLKEIPAPENLAVNGLEPQEFGRFTVAYGLCLLAYEDPNFMRLPSQVAKDESPIQPEYSQPENYENTRDLM